MDLEDESVYDYLEKETETAVAANGEGGKGEQHHREEKDSGGRSKRRTSDDDGHRSEHRSKRSRSEDDEKERDRSDRGDRSRHHRSNSNSRYERDRRHRGDESERDRDRERRSRREDRDRDRRKDRDDRKDDLPEKKERDKDHEFRGRKSRERKDKKDENAPAEAEADPERDQRTVFAWQICLKADEKHVYDFFSKAGKVRDVRLIMDRNSRRSKGVGYIEFYDAMSVPLALQLSGQQLLGQAVMVKMSEAEKNLAHSGVGTGGSGFSSGAYPGGARRLYVGNLHVNITEEQLRQVFEPFGSVELVQLPMDADTGLCKGYGFVQYNKLEDARAAQQALNGILELAGRAIKVSAVSDQQTGPEMGAAQNDLDDDEGGGLALNARSRALLMQKLDRSGGIPGTATIPPPMTASVFSGNTISNPIIMPNGLTLQEEPIGAPSECLLLKNMFDPETESEPDFDLDIKADVQEECSKFGHVKHISVDKHSYGHVYVRFSAAIHALAAQQALHKRWFAGKLIQATFMPVSVYENKFPASKSSY